MISFLWSLGRLGQENRSQVLMYHSIGGNAEGDIRGLYSIDPDTFCNQIDVLSDRALDGHSTIVPFGSEQLGQISITFDDGYLDNLTIAAPVCADRGIPFHVFLCPMFIESGRSGFLSRQDVSELAGVDGVTLGVHGYSHTRLTTLSAADVKSELVSSRKWLEDIVQKPVTSMSYPHGAVSPDVMNLVLEAGFTHAACSKCGQIDPDSSPLAVPRVDVWSSDTSRSFTQKINGHWDWMKWRT